MVVSNYAYDHLDRLTDTVIGLKTTGTFVATSSTDWTYDLNGNRTQQAVTGTGAGTTNYGYNAADQLCWTASTTGIGCTTPTGGTSYTYDSNGNQTTGGNTYTSYDQLATADTVGAQTYAGTTNNERSQAGTVAFTNGVLGAVSSTATATATQEYIRDPSGTLIAMQIIDTGGTHEYYYTADTIGSTIAITGSTGTTAATYTYDSYGTTTNTTGGTFADTTNPWRYATGYTDPNGTIKFGARYYQPTLGRFTQPDPSGQEPNNYAYAGDNPITNTDPTGLSWSEWGSIIGGVVGAVATGFACSATALVGCVVAGVVLGAKGPVSGGFLGAAFSSAASGNDGEESNDDSVSWGDVGLWAAGGSSASLGLGIYSRLSS